MKFIMVCKTGYQWVHKYLPSREPFLLSICNKSIIEYYIDLCDILGIDEIRLLCGNNYSEIQNHIGDGSQWNKKITYGFYPCNLSSQYINEYNRDFIEDDNYFLVTDLIFTFYDKSNPNIKSFIDKNKNNFISKTENTTSFFVLPIENISSYYQLSQDILYKYSNNYYLPGYGKGSRSFVGKDVFIGDTATVSNNVVIGDESYIEENTLVNEGSIIGNHVYIGEGTKTINSIILSDTILAEDLKIEGKIIDGNNIIDHMSGTSCDISDFSTTTHEAKLNISNIKRLITLFFSSIIASLMLLLLFIPYFIYKLFDIIGLITLVKTYHCINDKKLMNKTIYTEEILCGNNILSYIYDQLLLSKFNLFKKVLSRKVTLGGILFIRFQRNEKEEIDRGQSKKIALENILVNLVSAFGKVFL